MTRPDSVFDSGAAQGYFLLLLASGAALLFSIPAGAYVSDLMESSWKPSPLVFHLTYITLLGLFGTFRGIAGAGWEGPVWSRLFHLARHVLFGQLIVSPYLFFSRALLPGRSSALPLLAVYTTVVAFTLALIAFRLERWGQRRGVRTFLLQYVLFALLLVAPWALGMLSGVPDAVGLLSPIGAGLRILGTAPAAELAVAFVFVLIVLLIQILGIRRSTRRNHAV